MVYSSPQRRLAKGAAADGLPAVSRMLAEGESKASDAEWELRTLVRQGAAYRF